MFALSFLKDNLSSGYQFVTDSIAPLFSKKLFEKAGKILGGVFGLDSLGKIIGSGLSAIYQKGFKFDFIQRNAWRCFFKECSKRTLGKTANANAVSSFIFDVFYESETDSNKIIRNVDKAAIIASLQLLLSPSVEAIGFATGQFVSIQTGIPYAGAFSKFLVEAGCRSTISATTAHLFEKCMPRDEIAPIFATAEFMTKFRKSFLRLGF